MFKARRLSRFIPLSTAWLEHDTRMAIAWPRKIDRRSEAIVSESKWVTLNTLLLLLLIPAFPLWSLAKREAQAAEG